MLTAITAALRAIAAAFGFGTKVVEQVHDDKVEAGGIAKQRAADQAETIKEVKVAQNIDDAAARQSRDRILDQLRDAESGR